MNGPPYGCRYLVVRLMPAVYQRESITIQIGPPRVHVGFRDTFAHHPAPFTHIGQIGRGLKELLIAATAEAVERTGFRMCLVWSTVSCTFVERDGVVNESDDPPDGGLDPAELNGSQAPFEIEFDFQSRPAG